MPISGYRPTQTEWVPAIKNGKRIACAGPPESGGYSLESAQHTVDVIRKGLDGSQYLDEWLDPDTLEELTDLARDTDKVIAAGRRELDRIQAKREKIHSREALLKYDGAINELRLVIDRHVRMRTRIYTVLQRARIALTQRQREKRLAAKVETTNR